MVRSRLAAFTAVLACVLAVLFVAAGTASARHHGGGGGGISGNPPGDGGSQPPGGGSSSGSSGDPTHGTHDGCSLYANSSSFGLSCVTGGSGDAKTVKEILDGDTPPICWDAPISDSDLTSQYGYQQNPAAPYYLYSCISNLQLDQSLFNQTPQLDQHVIEIGQNAPQCDRSPTGEIKLKPDQTEYDCVMTLTQNQQTVVNGLSDFHNGNIPGLVITTHPSTKVRTNEAVAYTDRAENGEIETPHITVGGVTMWATMDRFTIYPYGPDGGVSKVCTGAANVSDQDTPQTKPDACWWTYPQSSADQPGQVYPFRAEADWTVYVNDIHHPFAHFQKYDDLQLPVFDIQSLIVH